MALAPSPKSGSDGYTILVHSNGLVTTPADSRQCRLRSCGGFFCHHAVGQPASGAE